MPLVVSPSHFSSNKKSDFNHRKRNFKLGLENHIAINMVNEAIDEEKFKNSKKLAILRSQKNIVIMRDITNIFPLVGINIFMMKFKKDCNWVAIILLRKSMMKN